jgi:hypothetical protein
VVYARQRCQSPGMPTLTQRYPRRIPVPDFVQLFQNIGNTIQHSARQMPTAVRIPNDHVDEGQRLSMPFQRDENYFQVRINEMFLGDQRQWLSTIDPVVFVVSEFTYAGKEQSVPFVVGPGLVEKFGQKTPRGMLFRNTRVAGLHPYRGGRLTLSVVLCQVVKENYARTFLQLIESASTALDFATMLTPYLKIGTVVADGVEALFGFEGTKPLIALRTEFDPDAGDTFTPGYYVLIDAPNVAPQSLWVREQQLLVGNSLQDATPYRDADYVLYSIVRPADNQRSDLDQLPFNELWQRVLKEAGGAKDENYASAKANMVSLYQTLVMSPDLTSSQADSLADEYAARMQQVHKRAISFGNLGPEEGKALETEADHALEDARARSLKILGG